MKIMWMSNASWVPSGYGQQTGMFLPRIMKMGHEVALLAYVGLETGTLLYDGYLCLPRRFHIYGNDVSVVHSQNWGANILLSLMDTWVMNPEEYPPLFRWVPWYPIDHDPMPAIVRNKLSIAWKRIAMSKFGVEKTHEAGMDCYYIPHGVDTKVFTPMDKAEARKRLGLPPDKWIVGTVAMNKGNPSRKAFTEMMHAFANFHKRHPESLYVLQTAMGSDMQDAVNLPELIGNLGLEVGKDVVFCDQYRQFLGFDTGYLASVYNAMDVMMLVSMGEGFGIPLIEAQACGTPVITGAWTACEELCYAGRLIDKKDADPWYTPLATYQLRPRVRAIELALEAEYKHPSPGDKAVQTIRENYDVEVVTEKHWKPTLAEIDQAVKEQFA